MKKIARKRDNFQEDEKNIKKFKYEISFWKSHKYLFLGMMKYYKDLSKFYGFKPIFLLQHSKLSLEYCVTKSPDQIPWNDVISVATKKFPEINFLDESHIYDDSFMIKSLHGKNYHTPKANKIIAEFLNEKLKY